MILTVQNAAYQIDDEKVRAVRLIARGQVPHGIYCIQKKGYMQLRNDTYSTRAEMQAALAEWSRKGFIAFWRWE